MREVTLQLSDHASRGAIVLARDEDLAVGEVVQSAGMIGMKVRKHDHANLLWLDSDPPQLGADLRSVSATLMRAEVR